MKSVLQEWAQSLNFMQQSVLIASIRGPDGIEKNHVSKLLIRWLRRCVLYSAFESRQIGRPFAFTDPAEKGGGSFTGPSILPFEAAARFTGPWQTAMRSVVDEYLQHLDETPHHFQLHFMHAVEIIGYKHPVQEIREWWNWLYKRLANDMHLNPETEEQMDKRLGDSEADWRSAEEVTAKGPSEKTTSKKERNYQDNECG